MRVVSMSGIRLDAASVAGVASFWAELLRGRVDHRSDTVTAVIPPDPWNYPILVYPSDTAKTGQNRIHLDLTSTSANDMHDTLARVRDLGGRPVDIGQSPHEKHTVMADPEGNEFCVIEPGNSFLANTGVIGAVNCDGTRALGYFWSRALGWPLVWDQDEETAIQSPNGGSKVTWSGPPLMPRPERDRVRLEVAAAAPLPECLTRLTSLGARIRGPVESAEAVTLLDPDGNEFHLIDVGAATRPPS